ncbi:MAG: ExbD/TolR family protein [Chitinophagaceae bacterium]
MRFFWKYAAQSSYSYLNQTLWQPLTHLTEKAVKKAITIDLTPMVYLGLLLITFFVITTNLQEQKVSKLNLPSNGDSTAIAASGAITLQLFGYNEIRYDIGNRPSVASIAGYGPNQLRQLLLQFKK